MLKYHVAVCDDQKSDLDGIVQSVQQYDVQGCFDIETYMDGNELLSELQMQKKSFDLLLLDIEMPSNGFQLAQSLIQMEKHPWWYLSRSGMSTLCRDMALHSATLSNLWIRRCSLRQWMPSFRN